MGLGFGLGLGRQWLDVGAVWRWSRLRLGIERSRRPQGLIGGRMLIRLVRRQLVLVLECRPGLVRLGVLVERLPLLRRGRWRRDLRFDSGARGRRIIPAHLRPAPDGTEGLAFSALDFGRVRTPPPLQVEVLADRVV